jgi:hypothetical protein
MIQTRLINESGEAITLQPGEAIDIRGMETSSKGLTSRLTRVRIDEVVVK